MPKPKGKSGKSKRKYVQSASYISLWPKQNLTILPRGEWVGLSVTIGPTTSGSSMPTVIAYGTIGKETKRPRLLHKYLQCSIDRDFWNAVDATAIRAESKPQRFKRKERRNDK